MAIIERDQATLRAVRGITSEEEQAIFNFIQGAVYSWCKNRKNEWFAMRDLMGGDNFYWEGTPLYALYKKHEDKDTSVNDAGKDAGWILKKVIETDKREYYTKKDGLVRMYRWDGDSEY